MVRQKTRKMDFWKWKKSLKMEKNRTQKKINNIITKRNNNYHVCIILDTVRNM